jgi:hypothetical protein
MNYWHTDSPVPNKLGMTSMTLEALFLPHTFNFLLLIIPTKQLVRNSEVGGDEPYFPFSVRHAVRLSVPDFQKSL